MADKGKGWDLTSTHALEGACEWIRKRSGALMVVAIRVEDSAIAADVELPIRDLLPRLELEMPDLAMKLANVRHAARTKEASR
jgi:hypothetical protein